MTFHMLFACNRLFLKGALAHFLFRLLHRLQSLGTVPAVDWNRYASVIGQGGA